MVLTTQIVYGRPVAFCTPGFLILMEILQNSREILDYLMRMKIPIISRSPSIGYTMVIIIRNAIVVVWNLELLKMMILRKNDVDDVPEVDCVPSCINKVDAMISNEEINYYERKVNNTFSFFFRRNKIQWSRK